MLDVSAGGLCIVAPVRFQNRMTVQITIDDPRQGPIEVEAMVWHERRFKQPSSGRKGWATGMVLSKGGPDFQKLATPGAALEEPVQDALDPFREDSTPAAQDPLDELPDLDVDASSVYRVRVKRIGTPRVRVLTLAAASEAAVREAVLSDLEGDWQVLDVETDPID